MPKYAGWLSKYLLIGEAREAYRRTAAKAKAELEHAYVEALETRARACNKASTDACNEAWADCGKARAEAWIEYCQVCAKALADALGLE